MWVVVVVLVVVVVVVAAVAAAAAAAAVVRIYGNPVVWQFTGFGHRSLDLEPNRH